MSVSQIARVLFAALVILGGLFSAPMPISSAQPCPDVEAVFARGTGEPPGVGGIGEAFVDELRTAIAPRSLDVYPVNYEASGDFSDRIEFAQSFLDGVKRRRQSHRGDRGELPQDQDCARRVFPGCGRGRRRHLGVGPRRSAGRIRVIFAQADAVMRSPPTSPR